MSHTYFRDLNKEIFIKEVQSGMTQKDLAAKYGVNVVTIADWRRRLSLSLVRHKKQRNPAKKKQQRKTNEQFLSEIAAKYGDEYTILEPYITAHVKIKMRHNVCGREIYKTPHAILAGHGCSKCRYAEYGRKHARTTEQFKKEVFQLVGDEYSVLGEYRKNNIPIKMRHNACGYEWKPIPIWFLKGTRCPKCMYKVNGEKRKMSHEEFVEKVISLEGDEYEVIGQYEKSDKKIEIKHSVCGQIYKVTPSEFLNGSRCPYCANSSKSKGERLIRKYLESKSIDFVMGYKIEECRNILPLPFDFAVFKGGVLATLIEFDGIQHFKPIKMFGGEEAFYHLKINDNIKTQYCKENSIPLIRISYRQTGKLHQILNNYLSSLGVLDNTNNKPSEVIK